MAIILDGTAGETFSGTGMRITGDFSNATVANRVMFQSSTVNGGTTVSAIPNGTSQGALFVAYGSSDPTNTSYASVQLAGGLGAAVFQSGVTGTGTYLPMTFYTGGSERARIDTSGNVGIGTSSPTNLGAGRIFATINGSTDSGFFFQSGGTTSGYVQGVSTGFNIVAGNNLNLTSTAQGTGVISWITGGSERMRIDSSGNVGIGMASPASLLHIYVNGSQDTLFSLGANKNNYITTSASGITVFRSESTERMRIDTSGNVLVTNPAGLGYGTGSGGTVTQATSKSTAVTLNKPTGQITMNNAALAAGASVFFTLNNTLIAVQDLVVTNCGSSGNYFISTINTSSGAVTFRVTNISAGSLSDAVVVNFAIIKGATS